jgi:hypothetical protein
MVLPLSDDLVASAISTDKVEVNDQSVRRRKKNEKPTEMVFSDMGKGVAD